MDERKKQIVEIARIVSKCITSWLNNETPKVLPDYVAEAIYNAGYRKQSVGEWKTNIPATIRVFETNSITCSLCGHGGGGSIDKPYPNFCPNCGAMMKGGKTND